LKILISQERKVLDLAAEGSDEVTVAMISDFLTEQEKSVWMLTSYLA
jgi:starvation-inducible DNA-binding protein